jgi:hypothetical protein
MAFSDFFRQCHKDDSSCLVQFARGEAAIQVQFALFCSIVDAPETKVKEPGKKTVNKQISLGTLVRP